MIDAMSTFRQAQIAEVGRPFSVVDQELPEPGRGHVRLVVEACGICGTDPAFVNAAFPDVSFPPDLRARDRRTHRRGRPGGRRLG